MTLMSLLAATQGLAAAASTPAKSTQTSGFGAWGLWVILGLMFVVMYFVLYRPQKKRSQEAQNMLGGLRRGDSIVTIGGIHGTIVKLGEDSVVVEVDKGVRLTFARSAIARTLTVHEEPEEEEIDSEEPEEEEGYEEEYAEEGDEEEEPEEEEFEEDEEPEAEPPGGKGGKGRK